MKLSYAGNMLPVQALLHLTNHPNSYLVDVRTELEWSTIGAPDLSLIDKETVLLSWRLLPSMVINNAFIELLRLKIPDQNSRVFFICKSGGRSQEAAIEATSQGYIHSYNVTDGFEGANSGWISSNLPKRFY